jgi:uncharacterized Zn finger protein
MKCAACGYEGDQQTNIVRDEKGEILFFRIGLALKVLVVCPKCGTVRAE